MSPRAVGPLHPEPAPTRRLRLRGFTVQDHAAFHRQINDWEICRRAPQSPYPYPEALARAWIDAAITDRIQGTAYEFAMIEAAHDRLIGSAGLRLAKGADTASLGYWTGRAHWRQGFAREALESLIAWGFAELPISAITADVAEDNHASCALLARLGFRQTGAGQAQFIGKPNERIAVLHFSLLRDLNEGFAAPANAERVEKPVVLVAACALINQAGDILLARRPPGKRLAGLWEFPGGKLVAGETPEAALVRELAEELGIGVNMGDLAPFVFASHAYGDFHLLMPLYLCRRWRGEPVGREGQALAWVAPHRLDEYPLPPADRPLIPMLRDFL